MRMLLGMLLAILCANSSDMMMHYLDQFWNSNYGPNKNYARELQELLTLGAVHSWGFYAGATG